MRYSGSKGRAGDISRPVEGAVNHIKRLFKGAQGKGSIDFYMQFIEERECTACKGELLNTEARYVTIADNRFPEITCMPIDALHKWIIELPDRLSTEQLHISGEIVNSILNKTKALMDVGLQYLTLKRSLPILSGGEAQRLRLSSQRGCGLTNLFTAVRSL